MKTANEILFEHGINTMSMEDDFNSQLLHAMERYAEAYHLQQQGNNLPGQQDKELFEWVKVSDFKMELGKWYHVKYGEREYEQKYICFNEHGQFKHITHWLKPVKARL